MNLMNNLLHSVLGLFLVRKVDSILDSLSDSIAKLDRAVEQHAALANKHGAESLRLERLADEAEAESIRAGRVANKLRDLVA